MATHILQSFTSTLVFIGAVCLAIYVGYLWKEYQHDKAAYEKERADEMAKRALTAIDNEPEASLLHDFNKKFGGKS